MPVVRSVKLLTAVEAATMLDPHVKPTNAMNWLVDCRRRNPHYKHLGAIRPGCLKHRGVWHYPAEEIDRVIKEIKTAKTKSP